VNADKECSDNGDKGYQDHCYCATMGQPFPGPEICCLIPETGIQEEGIYLMVQGVRGVDRTYGAEVGTHRGTAK
jgi:hypothetical protein